MVKNTLLAFLLLTMLTVSSPQAAIAQMPGHVTLATHNLCPYGCYDEEGIFNGSAVAVVTYVLREMGIPFKILVVPWERAQTMTYNGEADGFFAASHSPLRDESGVMSEIIAEQKWNWYLLKSNPLDPTMSDFKQKARVTSFIGANMLKWLRDNQYNVVTSPPTSEALAKMLVYQRFDAALANDQVMDKIIEKLNFQDRFKIYTLRDKPLGVYFSKWFTATYPEFLPTFNRLVRQCRQENLCP